jgi:hypothetical protein
LQIVRNFKSSLQSEGEEMKQDLQVATTLNRRYRCALYLFLALSILFAGAVAGWGQGGAKGSISGSVTDATGASIPGAQVTAINLDTGLKRSSVSKADGIFLLPLVDPGRYRVEITGSGFKRLVREPIVVSVTETADLGQLVLPIGEATETVTVGGQERLLQMSSTASRFRLSHFRLGTSLSSSRSRPAS